MMVSVHDVIQLVITLSSGVAIWLATSKNEKSRRRGAFIGLSSQPLWLYSTWTSGSWGIFLVTCAYIISFTRMLYPQWFEWAEKKVEEKDADKNHKDMAKKR